MKQLVLTIVSLILCLNVTFSQCPPAPVIFSSQQEIDDFATDYPDCTFLDELSLQGVDITSLLGLSQLEGIGTFLEISSTSLTNTDGLENLIEGPNSVMISNNDVLLDISGFDNTTYLMDLNIYQNPSLTAISGFENLADCFLLFIEDNDAIESLSAFSNLIFSEEINISHNSNLQSILGFESLTETNFVFIYENEMLLTIDAFNFATFINEVNIFSNNNLSNISGFEMADNISYLYIQSNLMLVDIGGFNNMSFLGTVEISQNPGLTDITGFNNSYILDLFVSFNESLMEMNGFNGVTIDATLSILNNDILSQIIGLDDADLTNMVDLVIQNNPELGFCSIVSICDWIDLGNTGFISSNTSGCNTQGEVEEICLTGACNLIVEITGPTEICPGDIITIEAVASNGTEPYSYEWSNGQTGGAIVISSSGLYAVTATDAAGCTATNDFWVLPCEDCFIEADLFNVVCDDNGTEDPTDDTYTFIILAEGQNVGAGWIADDPNGTTGFYGAFVTFGPYLISDGGFVLTLMDEDDPSCLFSLEVVPPLPCSEPCILDVGINGPTSICEGDVAILEAFSSGANGSVYYEWNFGPVGPLIEVSPTMTTEYLVIGTDDFGCMDTASWTVEVFPNPQVFIDGPVEICDGSTETLTAVPFDNAYTYFWSTGQIGSEILIDEFGLYSVTLTTENGCETTNELFVEQCSGECIIEYLLFDSTCDDNGTIDDPTDDTWTFDIFITGENTGTTWSATDPNATTGIFGGPTVTFGPYFITEGNLNFTIIDDSDPSCTAEVFVSAPDPCSQCDDINLIIESPGEICPGDVVTLEAVADGGTMPYTYEWSTGETTAVIEVDAAGLYEVTATDADGCFGITEVELLDCMACDLNVDVLNVSCDNQGTDDPTDDTWTFDIIVEANNAGDSWIADDPSGTTGFYGELVVFGPYLISDGDIVLLITDLEFPECVISVVVSPPETCSGCELDIAIEGPQFICPDDIAILEASIFNGVPPYLYFWSDGQIGAVAQFMESGTYSVTATDDDGCDGVADFVLEVSEPIYLEILAEPTSVCNGEPVELFAEGEGIDLTYEWSTGETSQTILVLPSVPTTYSVTATDVWGCSESQNITISVGESDFNDFESGWGIWNDGGADAALSSNGAYANSGTHSLLIKDNTNTSVVTTDAIDLSGVTEFQIDFNYIVTGFNVDAHDFWLQISTDNGATFTTVEEWNLNDEFVNEVREFESVVVTGPFTSETKIRFRCDAAGNNDKVYIDDIFINACDVPEPSCSDGIQNGDETGIDCGGSMCAPCLDCEIADANDWESGWGIWNDGGDDAAISSNATYAYSGVHSLLIKDNTSTSVATTNSLDFSAVTEIEIDFNFITTGFDNDGQQFFLEISTNGGLFFETIFEWQYQGNFENEIRYFESISFTESFTNQTQLRFRCDATGNNDKVYIDDVIISTCSEASPCADVDFNDVETDWGIWNDGGDDAARSNNAAFANSGMYSFLIKDNTSTSVITTDPLDLSIYDSLSIDFNYIADGFNNSTQDFWLQISTDNGATFTTVADWFFDVDFVNGVREFVNTPILGPFTSETLIRFRCDATGNNDKIYLDDILIHACDEGNGLIIDDAVVRQQNELTEVSVYPNPVVKGMDLTVVFDQAEAFESISLLSVNGKLLSHTKINTSASQVSIGTQYLEEGIYVIQLKSSQHVLSKRIMIVR